MMHLQVTQGMKVEQCRTKPLWVSSQGVHMAGDLNNNIGSPFKETALVLFDMRMRGSIVRTWLQERDF